MKKLINLSLILILLAGITGCELKEQKNYINFVQKQEIEYSHSFNSCSLITSVEGYASKDFHIENDIIKLPNGKTVMCNTENKEPKLDTIKYTYSYRGSTQNFRIKMIDKSKPIIKNLKKEYVVQIGNEYFDLKNLIEVSDNYDKNVKLYFNGNYDVNKVGSYELEVIAEDCNKNKTIAKTKVIVKNNLSTDEEKNNNYSSSDSEKNSQKVVESIKNDISDKGIYDKKEENKTENSLPRNISKETRRFSIDDYNSFDECMNACNLYIQGNNGMCIPYKKDGLNAGYEAVFN